MKTNKVRVLALMCCARGMASAAMIMAVLTNASAAVRPSSIAAGDGQVAATIVDTITGMTWLSVNVTKGQTYAQAEQGVWADLGFRHASSQELLTLVADAGVNLGSAYWIEGWPSPGSFSTPSDVMAMYQLISLIGPTYWNNLPTGDDMLGQASAYGMLSDRYERPLQSSGHFFALLSASSSSALAEIPEFQLSDGHSDSMVGSFLVQPTAAVPEPRAAAMLLIGVASAMVRRMAMRRSRHYHGRV